MANQQKKQEEMNVEEAISKSEAFIVKYKKLIIIAVAAVIVVVAGIFSYKNYVVEPRELKASEAIFRAEQCFEAGDFELALAGDAPEFIGFQEAAQKYSNTKAGKLSKLYVGLCQAQLGQYEAAIATLKGYNGEDQLVGPAALGTLGDCYAQVGDLEKAAATLMKAADKADSNTLSPIYLIKAGKIYEQLGKSADAVKAYTLVKEKYFGSYQAMDIEKYIEHANK